jgi:YhcN/YlaJ family sporulation lipoprotein
VLAGRKEFILLYIFLMLVVGCWLQKRPIPAGDDTSTEKPPVHGNGLAEATVMVDKDIGRRAEKLKKAIIRIRNIRGVSVLIIGDTAIIGIRLIDQKDDDAVSKALTETQRMVAKADYAINDTVVTADDRLVLAVEKIEKRVLSGTPIGVLSRDIAEVLRCIDY